MTSSGSPASFSILLAITAFTLFTCLDSSAKWLALAGMSVFQVAFVRYLAHFLIATAVLLPTEGRRLFRTGSLKMEIARGIFLAGSTVFNFFAIQHLPLTVTISLMFLIPIFICLFSIPILKEKVGIRRWTAILVGFSGVLVITQPWSESWHAAAIVSVAAAMNGALYSVMTRKLAGVDSANTQQVYGGLTGTLILLPFVLGKWVWPQSGDEWFAFIMIGIFGWLGHLLLTQAHRYTEATVLAPFIYTQIISAALSSWIIFAQPPGPSIFAGVAIIAGSGLYIWWRERALGKTAAPETQNR